MDDLGHVFFGLGSLVLPGILTGVGFIVLCKRFNPWVIAGYAFWIDAIFSVGLPLLMLGTYTGVMTAVIAGLTFSAWLTWFRYWHGYIRWDRHNGWVYYPR